MSFDQLRDRSPAAVRLLQILAFCSPGPISTEPALLGGDDPVPAAVRLHAQRSADDRPDHPRHQPVRPGQGRPGQQFAADPPARPGGHPGPDDERGADRRPPRAAQDPRSAHGQSRARPTTRRTGATYEIIWPHLGPSEAEECDDPRTRQLLIDWVRYQWKVGEFEACLNLANRLEAAWSRQLGADDQQTLLLRFHIANVLRSQGRFREALRPRHGRSRPSARGARQRSSARADDRGQPRRRSPRRSATSGRRLSSDKRTYASFKEQFGEDYPRTLMAAFNLAISYRLNGDYAAARRLDEDTLDRRRVVLPRRSPLHARHRGQPGA